MNKRKLGSTGIEVSEISFGGVAIGLPYGLGVTSQEDMLRRDAAVKLLQESLDKGITFYDTARVYGISEELMGQAFERKRGEVVIATKCAHTREENGNLLQGNELKKTFDNSVSESLGALKTDYFDLYMSHDGVMDVIGNDDIIENFVNLKQKGVSRAIGISTYSPAETKAAIDSGVWDVIQVPFNLMNQSHSVHFDLAKEKEVGLVIRSVLFKGILTDRGTGLHPALKKVEEYKKNFEKLASDCHKKLSEFATRFVLSSRDVSSVLVGIDRREYLDQALAVADGICLDNDALKAAQELAYPDPDFLDLAVWDRKGWLK